MTDGLEQPFDVKKGGFNESSGKSYTFENF